MHLELAKDIRHNFRISTTEGMFASVTTGMALPFFGLFAVYLNASNTTISLITSLPAFVNLLFMLLAAGYVDRFPSKLPLVVKSAILHRVFYLPMALIPFFAIFQAEFFVSFLFLMTIPQVVLNLSWTSLIGNLFPLRYRGELFGRRNMICGSVSMIGTILAGILLDTVPEPYNWFSLFFISFLAGMTSSSILRKHQEIPTKQKEKARNPLEQVRNMFQDEHGGKLKVFLLTSLLFHFGINFSAPLWAIYFGRELGLANSLIGAFSTVMGATTVLCSMFWGKRASLYGNEIIFAVSLFGMSLWPFFFALSSQGIYMLILHGVLGIFVAAFNLTIFNMLLSASSMEHKTIAIASFHTLNALTGIIAPFLGTWSLTVLPIQGALVISSLLRCSGFVVFILGNSSTLLASLGRIRETVAKRRSSH